MKTLPLLFLLLASGACDDVKYISKRNSGRMEQLLSSFLPLPGFSPTSVVPLELPTDALLLFLRLLVLTYRFFQTLVISPNPKNRRSLSGVAPPPGLLGCCFRCVASCSSALLWPSRTATALFPSPPPLPVGHRRRWCC